MSTSINYPATLPNWLREGYGYSLASLASRSDFPLGARQRQLYTDGLDAFAVSAFFSASQWAEFKGFWRHILKAGTQWVNLPLLTDGVVQTIEARFICTTLPSSQLMGANHWQVTLAIETRQGTTMSEAAYALLSAYPDSDSLAEVMQLTEIATNQDLAALGE